MSSLKDLLIHNAQVVAQENGGHQQPSSPVRPPQVVARRGVTKTSKARDTIGEWRGHLMAHFARMRGPNDPTAETLMAYWMEHQGIHEIEERRRKHSKATNLRRGDRTSLVLPPHPYATALHRFQMHRALTTGRAIV